VVTDLNYSTILVNARYGIFDERVTLTAGYTPSFGDFRRTAVDVGLQWSLIPAMTLHGQYSYFHNQTGSNDDLVSVRFRYDL
jgi:hypothetical protein